MGMGHAIAAPQPIVIQFSHVVTPDAAKGKAAQRFKELAEARTQGRVKVEVYPNSSLYKDREEIEALRLGAVQMLAPSLSKLASVGGGDFEAFDLPFLFNDHAAFRAVVDGAVGAELLKKLEPSGIYGLAYWDNGHKVFTANRAMHDISDFKNLKVRVQASRVLVTQMKAVGAVPLVTPLANVYELLKNGQLDGEENTPGNITTQRLDEVQGHMTVSNHGYLAYAVIVNKSFWDKLPSDIRQVLQGAMRDATVYANALAEAENSQALERLKSQGRLKIHIPTRQELSQWRAAMQPVYQDSRSWISPEMLTAIKVATGVPP
jgi:C4-dicarboxylate-binding protein DctP